MKSKLKIHLKPKERIYINGASLRVDRKVTIELLNDVDFLLEAHVLEEVDATTPLRQLYYVIQSLLIEPQTKDLAVQIYQRQHRELVSSYMDREILEGLVDIKTMIEDGRAFDALKRIRGLLPIEDEIEQPVSGAGKPTVSTELA